MATKKPAPKKKLGAKAAEAEVPAGPMRKTLSAPVPETEGQAEVMEALNGDVHNEEIKKHARAVSSEWNPAEVFVAFPCQRTTNPVTAWCLQAMCRDFGDKVHFDLEMGDSMVYHSRNRLADRFLATDASYILFIDDDMAPPIGRPDWLKRVCRLPDDYPAELAGVQTLERLISHGVSLVGGAYFGRRPNAPLLAGKLGAASMVDIPMIQAAQHGLMDVEWVGTGCLLVHRQVFEDIKEKFPEQAPEANEELSAWNFFPPIRHSMGEDQGFCKLAAAAGHQPYVDFGLQVPHIGFKAWGIADHHGSAS